MTRTQRMMVLLVALAGAAAGGHPAVYNHSHPQGEPRLRKEGPYYVYDRELGLDAGAQSKATQEATAFAESLYGKIANDKFRESIKRQSPAGNAATPAPQALVPAVKKALKNGRLTLAFTGMSAAEGAGNYLNESYPYVVQRLIGPAFSAAGVETWTSNFALGATHSRPHPTFCIAGTFGRDVDAAFWWFDMTERGNGGPEAFAIGLTKAYGNIPITIASGSPDAKAKAAATQASGPVLSYSINHAIGSDKALNENPNCVEAVIAPEGKCDKTKYHPHTGDDAHRRGCGGQVSWHPGWATHQAYGTGIALAWLDALKLVQSGANVPVVPDHKPAPPEQKNDGLLRAELFAGLACATGYRPHAGRGVHTLLAPAQRKSVEAHEHQHKTGLHGRVGRPDAPLNGCTSGHPEHKGSMAVSKDMGNVTFILAKAKRGGIIICEPLTLWEGGITMVGLSGANKDFSKINLQGLSWTVDGTPLRFQALPGNGKPQHCYKSDPVLAPRLTLRVDRFDGRGYLSISHVIWPSDDVLY